MKGAAKSYDIVDVETDDEEESGAADTSRDLIFDTLGSVEPGLVVVTVPTGLMLSHVRMAIERQIRSGGQKLGIRFPKKMAMTSLYPGGGRKVREAKALAQAQTPIAGAATQEFAAIGTRDGFTLTCDEGLCAVLPLLEQSKDGWATCSQSIDACPPAAVVEALMKMRAAAKQAGSYVLFFLVTGRKPEELQLQDYCDDLLVTANCEPEPGVQFAFSIDVVGLRNLNEVGIGKTMCSVRARKGQYVSRWDPFIAVELLKRVIWKLRCSGKSLAEIGKIVGCDKSTVHRHMAGLPPVVKREFKEDWLKPYADLIEIAIESDETAESEDD